MDLQNTKCPFCLLIIENKENIVVCSTCKKAHHKECWNYNLNRCTTFACKGIAIDYDLMVLRENEKINSIVQNNINENKNYVPVKYKPDKPLPNPKNKSVNENNKKILVKNTKLSDVLKYSKKQNNINNKISPAPEYIPDYVYDSLSEYHKKLNQEKMKMSSLITKNPYRNLKYNDKKFNKHNNLPKPPEYIPDYVNEDIKEYHKRLNSEKPKSLIFKKMGNFITKNIRKKRQEYVLPKPDPFIPEFVHRDLKEYVKELIEERKSKISKKKYKSIDLSEFIVNENIIYESDIPKPEIIAPEYVNSKEKNFDINFILSLVETKKCINCKRDILFNLEFCNFCNSNQFTSNSTLVDYSNVINELVSRYRDYDLILENKNIYVNTEEVKKIFLSPLSKYITFVNQNNYLRIIDIDTLSIKNILKGHKGKITSVLFPENTNFVYTGSTDTFIKKWDINSGNCLDTLEGHEITVDLLNYSYINQNIISGGGFGILKVWDIGKNKIKKVINDNSKWINTLDYSINNFFFATGNSENIINIWEANKFHLVKTLVGHLDQITCVKYSPNGYFLASSSNDSTIKIWDTTDFSCISTIKAHNGSINYIDYSPDSKLLVSCGNDKTIKIWNLNNYSCIKILIGHTESVNCAKFSPNGKYILSCSDDKTIKIWKLV